MTQVINKSIRLSKEVAEKLQRLSIQSGMSQGKLIKKMTRLYEIYLNEKEYEKQLMEMSKDEEYLKEQIDLANSNFL